jgi:hypothetical protein
MRSGNARKEQIVGDFGMILTEFASTNSNTHLPIHADHPGLAPTYLPTHHTNSFPFSQFSMLKRSCQILNLFNTNNVVVKIFCNPQILLLSKPFLCEMWNQQHKPP